MFYPQFLIPEIILQAICIWHVLRNGRDRVWIFVIMLLPVFGIIAYFFAEILPTFRSRSIIENANQKIGDMLIPSRRIKDLEDQLALADTYQNRMQLGEAYAASQRYEEAIHLFSKALSGIYSDDPFALSKRACAYYASDNLIFAKKDFEMILSYQGKLEEKEQLIYAITLDTLGDNVNAEKAFQKAALLSTGLEAEYLQAVFLKKLKKTEEAVSLLEHIQLKAKSSPPYFRRRESKWLDLAKGELQSIQK